MTIIDAAGMRGGMADARAEMVDTLVGIDAAISSLIAARTELLETMRVWSELEESAGASSSPDDIAFRSLRAEVSCALRVPERQVERLFGEARMLVRALPATMTALRSGEITYRHAQVMVDEGAGLEAEQLRTFERLAVPVAATSTVAAFGRAARRLREGLDPSTIDARTRAAAEKREAVVVPGRDGMGDLILHLPMHEVQAIFSRGTELAMRMQGPDEPRTVAQLRADVLRDALLTGTFEAMGGRRIRSDVYITIPVLSLLGKSDQPATLDGYGPISLDTARELAADAPSFVRILTHPETGVVMSVGKERYSPPADMKTAMRARGSTCDFPTCSRPAEFCDLDHIIDWAKGGTTSIDNLAFLCPGHHTLKHATPWEYGPAPSGRGYDWVSPAGKTYFAPRAGLV